MPCDNQGKCLWYPVVIKRSGASITYAVGPYRTPVYGKGAVSLAGHIIGSYVVWTQRSIVTMNVYVFPLYVLRYVEKQ